MILYRKGGQVRLRRAACPEPPFWCATTLAPYSARRASPVAIDYLSLNASSSARLEVAVSDDPAGEMERLRSLTAPILIEATEHAEKVFRRGEDLLAWCDRESHAAIELVSTRGVLPSGGFRDALIAIAAWPFDGNRLAEMFAAATHNALRWGVAVPVIYPVTTDLPALEALADSAATHGAAFLAPIALHVEATARQAIAQSVELAGDDDRYAMLFHGEVEPLHLATERHICALAAERGLADFVVPPRWEERSNWNAAVLLTRTASRMIAMELDLDLAGVIARSGRAVAELDKPLSRIAEAANLAIVGALDDVSIEMLTEWLDTGSASFADYVDEQWRVRRG